MWFDLIFILNELLKLLNLWWQDQSTFIILAIEVGDFTFFSLLLLCIEDSLMILEWRVSQKNLCFISLLLFWKKKSEIILWKNWRPKRQSLLIFHCAKATVDDHTGPGGVISLRCSKSHFRLNPRTRRSDFSIILTWVLCQAGAIHTT